MSARTISHVYSPKTSQSQECQSEKKPMQGGGDPIFAAIARHQAAHVALLAAIEDADAPEPPPGAQSALEGAHSIEDEAIEALVVTTPQSSAGARAAIAYIIDHKDFCVRERGSLFLAALLRAPFLA